MKKRIKIAVYIISLGIIGLVVSMLLQQRNFKESKVTPDSGNDFSYDSGSSSDFGGSGGLDYGGSSGDGESNPAIAIIVIGGFAIAIVALLVWDHNSAKKFRAKTEESNNKLREMGYNPEELCKQAFYVYTNIQYAWMNFDYKTLRYYLSDELYNNYVELLEQKKIKGEKNIMEDITMDKSTHIESYEFVDDKLILIILLSVHQKDYIVDSEGTITRGDTSMNDVSYRVTYELSKEKINICPNCGAKLSQASSEVCTYCGSVIINKNHGLIMIKKQIVSQ